MTHDEGHYYVYIFCDNLWKSKFMALEKPGNSGNFFLLLFGHPANSFAAAAAAIV